MSGGTLQARRKQVKKHVGTLQARPKQVKKHAGGEEPTYVLISFKIYLAVARK